MTEQQHHRLDHHKAGLSAPAYPFSHDGQVCIVVGTHPCWSEDVYNAMQNLDHVDFCAVNEATRLVHPNHVATVHTAKIDHFMSLLDPRRLELREPIVHVKAQKVQNYRTLAYEWVMDMWAGSAIFAAMAMVSIGYDQVILCGCPMDGGGGYAFDTHKSTPEDPRIGDMAGDSSIIQGWAQAMRQIKETMPAAERIRSMSGTTQHIFGGL